MFQKTIKKSVQFEGVGLHSGKKSRLGFLPAPVNHGIVFVRTDLPDQPKIPALAANLDAQERNTGLKLNGARIQTVEHILAALAGLGLTNLIIEINSEEPPILDGSSQPYVEGLKNAGLMEQNKNVKFLEIKAPVFVEENESVLVALPSAVFKIFCYIDFPGTAIGRQTAAFVEGEDFSGQIAPARTFGFWQEIENLKAKGLAQGGSLDNAVIVGEKVYSTTLRFPDEPVRHKVLDLMGDLFLLGHPLKAHLIALKPSHLLNGRLVKKILLLAGQS